MLFGLEILEIIFCISVIAVGGFLRGFLGFGAALVIVPSLSIVCLLYTSDAADE